MWKRALAVLFAMMFLWRPNTAAAQDFEARMQAYAAGDHVAAVGEWISLAERGHVAAQTALVTLYYFTRDESLNSAELAFIWYRAAARAGDAEAKIGLARLHEKGRGVPRGLQVAATWYRQAAEDGQVQAQFQMGWIYSQGLGVWRNLETAYMWYEICATNGSSFAKR